MLVDVNSMKISTNCMSMVLDQHAEMTLLGAMAQSKYQLSMKLNSSHPISYFSN